MLGLVDHSLPNDLTIYMTFRNGTQAGPPVGPYPLVGAQGSVGKEKARGGASRERAECRV